MNNIIKKYITTLKSPKLLVIIGIIGILLIFLSSLPFESGKETEKDKNEFSAEEYRKDLEEDISEIVRGITGSRNASVVVTLDSSIRYSYAETNEESLSSQSDEKTESNDSQLKEGYITVKTSDGGEQALLVTAQMPEIRGVAIVCEGGDSEIISQKIQSAVTSALNITSKRVYVCGRKQ